MAEDAELLETDAPARPRRLRRRVARIGGGLALVLALAAGGLWLARKPIADSFIARELAAQGVQGRYQVTRIGPRTQRLDNLVIGDPKRPDLTVRFLEVDIGWGLTGARITRVQASGVRLRGQIKDGALDLGQVSRLLEGGDGEAELPDWNVQVEDAIADISSDFGRLSFAVNGQGPLRNGFAGKLGLAAPLLQLGGCRAEQLRAPLDVTTQDAKVALKGPLSTPEILCPDKGLALAEPVLDVNVQSDLALKDIGGVLAINADGAQQQARRLERLSGLITFAGSAENLRGSGSVSAATSAFDGVESDAVKLGGGFALRLAGRDKGLSWNGVGTIDNARPAKGIDLGQLTRSAAGTPVGPLVEKLAQAIGRIGKANRLLAGGTVNLIGNRGNAVLDKVELTSPGGARLATGEGTALHYSWPGGSLAANGILEMRGDGLPEGRVTFAADEGGRISGTANFADYAAGTARLGLAPVRFALEPGGRGRISTVATLDGPLPDGALSGLTVPVDAVLLPGGGIRLSEDCAPVRWRSLRLSSLTLNPANVRLCGISDGEMRLAATALTGRIGTSPLAFSASSVRYGLGSGRFELAAPDVRIGPAASPVRLAAARLVGQVGSTAAGIAGTFEGGTGRIGSVPLDLTEMGGRWSFVRGKLSVDGALRVADTEADMRFKPLLGQDVKLTLANNRIDATGLLVHPERQTRVASVVIRHDLSSAAGQADLKVDGLRFGDAIQPDDVTPLALGVIANVEGPVTGAGQIRWTGTDVTSTGTFVVKDMAFAAAFGPVTGFSTTIRFTDLLGLRTEPGQVMTVGSVNPGIDVRDGEIRYALLSKDQARIEGGRWPFSGGTLELLPSTLDLDSKKARALTFRVVGLEAGAFINTLELDNISATGTFDGLLPMIFDEGGGRIEGGLLIARQVGNPPLVLNRASDVNVACDPLRQSGSLAYVGEVSNAQLGAFGKLAFDALKNLRYRCLTILLDGALDGEFVTNLQINGVNQGTDEARRSFLTRPFIGLPFLFNVRIEAPFRGLLSTAAGVADPTAVIRDQMGKLDAEARRLAPLINQGTLAVQPPDSEKRLEKEQK